MHLSAVQMSVTPDAELRASVATMRPQHGLPPDLNALYYSKDTDSQMMKFKCFYASVFLSGAVIIPISAQQVVGVTATQAVLHYQSASSAPCQVQASTSRSMSPLVPDVDPALFVGANLDSRPGGVMSQGGGNDRYFVVGKRRADLASDGKHYSRALQAFTEYFFQVNCGGTLLSGRFVTSNPPLGNNFPEPPPFDSQSFGNYAWPTIDWNDQTKTYVDPMTGILLKRATSPGWYGSSQTGKTFGFAFDLNGAWANPSNILSGTSATRATYSGTGGDPIFLAFDPSQLTGNGGANFSGWGNRQTMDNMMVRVFGTGTGTISGCLSDDSGAHCVSPAVNVVKLGASGGNPAGTYPASCASDGASGCFPNNGFWGGWNFTPSGGQLGVESATVNLAGSSVTAGSGTFNLNWKAGGKIYIAGSAPGCANNLCTIASVNSSSSLTILESAGTLSGAAFKNANAGIVLWVSKGSGLQTASISVNFDYSYSDPATMPLNGTVPQCSPNSTTVSWAADGVTPIPPVAGELCITSQSLYLLIPSTGETRFLAPLSYFSDSSDAAVDQASGIQALAGGFDAGDPNTFYVQATPTGGLSVFRGVYNAAVFKYRSYPHSLYPSNTASYVPGQDTTQYWYRGPAWSDTGITWTNMTKPSQNLALGAQIAAGDPNWDPNIFLSPGVTAVGSGRAFTGNGPVGYGETVGLIHSFDLSTGKLVQSATTWTSFPARWCGIHSLVFLSGWYGMICNPLGGAYGFNGNSGLVGIGPWQMTPTAVYKNGAFNPDTSMTASSPRDACPAIPSFLSSIVPANPACVTFQSQMACSHSPHAGENTKWPCEYNPNWSELQPVAPGDGILVTNGPGHPETLLVVSVQALGGMNYQFTAVRGTTVSGYKNASTAWTGLVVPPTTDCDISNCTPGIGMWFNGTGSSVTWMLDPGAFAAHSDLGNAPTPGANSYCQTASCRFNVPMAQQIGSFAKAKQFQQGSFAGVTGAIAMQGYPSVHQLMAPPSEQVWMLNFRHLNPSTGVGAENPSPVGAVTYNLVSGTQGVFRFTSVNGGLHYKLVPVIAYAGYHLLQDVSSPSKGNIITDSTPWNYCVVLNAGECETGSAAGEVYMSVPQGVVRGDQNCVSNWYDDNFPCVFTPPAQAAFGIQQGISRDDPNGTNWRRITMGLSGPGRQFQFGSFIPDPTGTWAFMQGYWLDGVRNDLMIAKLPPWPNPQDVTTNRTNFVPQPIQVSANSNVLAARVRFGYAENGAPGSFFCTPRREACITGGSPYSFQSENPGWQPCASGCTIPVPAIPGRVLFYAVDSQDGAGNTIPGNVQVLVVR
jgi:hypothetical protein